VLWRFKQVCMCLSAETKKPSYTNNSSCSSDRSTDLSTLEVHYAKRVFSLAVSCTAVGYSGSSLFFIVPPDLCDPMSRLVTSACDREFKVRGVFSWTFVDIRGCSTPAHTESHSTPTHLHCGTCSIELTL